MPEYDNALDNKSPVLTLKGAVQFPFFSRSNPHVWHLDDSQGHKVTGGDIQPAHTRATPCYRRWVPESTSRCAVLLLPSLFSNLLLQPWIGLLHRLDLHLQRSINNAGRFTPSPPYATTSTHAQGTPHLSLSLPPLLTHSTLTRTPRTCRGWGLNRAAQTGYAPPSFLPPASAHALYAHQDTCRV
jgi:hypothetical protein